MDEISVKLTEIEARSKSNSHRIDQLENATRALNELAVSVRLLAIKQDSISEKVNNIDEKVSDIEMKPARRWGSISEKVILLAVTAVTSFLLARLGL